MQPSLSSRIAVITGAAQGIGWAIAERLAKAGASVALVDRSFGQAEGITEPLVRQGLDAAAFQCDVTDTEQVNHTIQAVVRQWGRLDILVNNAGVAGQWGSVMDMSDADWQHVLTVNLTGVFKMTRAALPHMVRSGWGRVINMASIAGKEGNPAAAHYSASKGGLIAFTKAVAKEVATLGITVNAVAPAPVHTPLLNTLGPQQTARMLQHVPMRRLATPEEVAAMVLWIASEECSFTTGASFDLSGGRATY